MTRTTCSTSTRTSLRRTGAEYRGFGQARASTPLVHVRLGSLRKGVSTPCQHGGSHEAHCSLRGRDRSDVDRFPRAGSRPWRFAATTARAGCVAGRCRQGLDRGAWQAAGPGHRGQVESGLHLRNAAAGDQPPGVLQPDQLPPNGRRSRFSARASPTSTAWRRT